MVIPPPVSVKGFMMSQTAVLVCQSSRPPTIWYEAPPVLAVRSRVARPRREVAVSLMVALFPVPPGAVYVKVPDVLAIVVGSRDAPPDSAASSFDGTSDPSKR